MAGISTTIGMVSKRPKKKKKEGRKLSTKLAYLETQRSKAVKQEGAGAERLVAGTPAIL